MKDTAERQCVSLLIEIKIPYVMLPRVSSFELFTFIYANAGMKFRNVLTTSLIVLSFPFFRFPYSLSHEHRWVIVFPG